MRNPSKAGKVGGGIAPMGYTPQLPPEDRYLLTRSEFLDLLAVLLGGRGAEALTFGEVTTDALNDLQQATDIARRMVKEYGMSKRLGAVLHAPERPPPFPPGGNGLSGGTQSSEATTRENNDEVERIEDETEVRGRNLLTMCGSQLQIFTERLLQKEILDGEGLQQLLAGSVVAGVPTGAIA